MKNFCYAKEFQQLVQKLDILGLFQTGFSSIGLVIAIINSTFLYRKGSTMQDNHNFTHLNQVKMLWS